MCGKDVSQEKRKKKKKPYVNNEKSIAEEVSEYPSYTYKRDKFCFVLVFFFFVNFSGTLKSIFSPSFIRINVYAYE